MNKIIIIILLIILSSFILAKDKVLWDLGMIIKSDKNQSTKNSTIKPLISNTHIMSSYKNSDNINTAYSPIGSIEFKHIIKLLYIKNQYFELTQYIKNLRKTNNTLNDEQILIYSDALYRLGNYSQAIVAINLLSEDYPLDEKYFTLALYNKKLGNIKNALDLLNNLISKYPNSEYIKLSKLQSKILK